METFNYIYPSPILKPYVKHYWTLKIDSSVDVSERIIPTGCMQLVFHRGNRIFSQEKKDYQPRSFLCGQTMGFSDVISSGKLNMIVVVFHPHGVKPFFKIPVNEFYNNYVSITDLNKNLFSEIEDRILNTFTDNQAIKIIEDFLINQLNKYNEYTHRRIAKSIEEISKNTQINVSGLADIACLSSKQFNRSFTEYIGINPKEFIRIVRFQRALYYMQTASSSTSLTQLANESGYFDQSHMIREFKFFSGHTPGGLIETCPPFSDYFSHL